MMAMMMMMMMIMTGNNADDLKVNITYINIIA